MDNDKQSATEGETTQERLARLAQELGIALEDCRQWLRDFGEDVVTAGVEAFDYDSLPFVGGEA